jgi:hypothetical protein
MLNAPSVIGRQLVIQYNTPSSVRGRVNSAFFLLRDLLTALGTAAAGLADLFDVRAVFLGATLLFAVACAVLLRTPGWQDARPGSLPIPEDLQAVGGGSLAELEL